VRGKLTVVWGVKKEGEGAKVEREEGRVRQVLGAVEKGRLGDVLGPERCRQGQKEVGRFFSRTRNAYNLGVKRAGSI